MSITPGNFHIPGYSGFVPGVQSENLFAGTYAKTTSDADTIRDRKKNDEFILTVDRINKVAAFVHPRLNLVDARSPMPRKEDARTCTPLHTRPPLLATSYTTLTPLPLAP